MTTQSISYVTTSTFEDIAARINSANRIMITTHRKPDGDAIGSVVGMYRALCSIGKQAEVIIAGPLGHGLAIIAGDTPIRFIEDDGFPEETPDLIMVLDTGAWSQLEAAESWLREHAEIVVGTCPNRIGATRTACGASIKFEWHNGCAIGERDGSRQARCC